jgi:hypothetical protein
MTDPIRQAYQGYTKKVQPVIVNDKLPGAVILIASILLCGVICLFSSCGMTPARAEEIDLNIIAEIESGNDPMAYNSRTQATGLYQITPICLADFRQNADLKEWSFAKRIRTDDLFDSYYNHLVANWYFYTRIPQLLRHYHKPLTLENILTAYNAGIKAVVKGYCPRETRNYIAKYKRLQKARQKNGQIE